MYVLDPPYRRLATAIQDRRRSTTSIQDQHSQSKGHWDHNLLSTVSHCKIVDEQWFSSFMILQWNNGVDCGKRLMIPAISTILRSVFRYEIRKHLSRRIEVLSSYTYGSMGFDLLNLGLDSSSPKTSPKISIFHYRGGFQIKFYRFEKDPVRFVSRLSNTENASHRSHVNGAIATRN